MALKPLDLDDPTLPALTVEEVDELDNASDQRWCKPPVLLAVRRILAAREAASAGRD